MIGFNGKIQHPDRIYRGSSAGSGRARPPVHQDPKKISVIVKKRYGQQYSKNKETPLPIKVKGDRYG
jgi:hypothetical protein